VKGKMKNLEPSLLQGYLLCIWDSEAIRLQTGQWKRNLLVFMSGVCLEISALPYLAGWMGYEATGPAWILTLVFLPLGLVGLYASKFGNDRFVEWLLVMPQLERKR
jgi:hypothetical protein